MIVNEENTHHDPKTLSILNSVQLSRCGCLRVWTHTAHRGLRSGRDSRAGARAPAPARAAAPRCARALTEHLSRLWTLSPRGRAARAPRRPRPARRPSPRAARAASSNRHTPTHDDTTQVTARGRVRYSYDFIPVETISVEKEIAQSRRARESTHDRQERGGEEDVSERLDMDPH